MSETITLPTLCSTKFDGVKKRYDAVTRPLGNLGISIGIAKTFTFDFRNFFEIYTTMFFVGLTY